MPMNYPEYEFGGNGLIPGASKPGEPTRLNAILQSQRDRAAQFRQGVDSGDYLNKLYAPEERKAKLQLGEDLKQNTKNYNSRGLLRSGMQTRDAQKAAYGTKASLDAKRYEIQQNLLNQADEMENAPIAGGFARAGLSPGQDNGLYNLGNSLKQDAASSAALNNMISSLFGGLSSGAGFYLGSRGK